MPFALYPSMLWYKPTCSTRSASPSRRTSTATKYKMPDGTRSTGTTTPSARSRCCSRSTTTARTRPMPDFDPSKIVQYGFEPQRDDLRGLGAVLRRRQPRRRGRQDGHDPGRLGGRLEVGLRRHLEGPLHHERPGLPDRRVQGGDDAFYSRQGRDEHELPVATCCIAEAGGNWNLGACRPTTGKVTRRSTPTRSRS